MAKKASKTKAFTTDPIKITTSEWMEILHVEDVREGWGLDDDVTVELIESIIYGVKFRFTCGSPGYCGDLFILQGDALENPMLLIRRNGVLVNADDPLYY